MILWNLDRPRLRAAVFTKTAKRMTAEQRLAEFLSHCRLMAQLANSEVAGQHPPRNAVSPNARLRARPVGAAGGRRRPVACRARCSIRGHRRHWRTGRVGLGAVAEATVERVAVCSQGAQLTGTGPGRVAGQVDARGCSRRPPPGCAAGECAAPGAQRFHGGMGRANPANARAVAKICQSNQRMPRLPTPCPAVGTCAGSPSRMPRLRLSGHGLTRRATLWSFGESKIGSG